MRITGLLMIVAGLACAQDTPPPAQQPAAQQPPAQQPTQQTPDQVTGRPNLKLPPPPPKVVDVRMPGEAGISFGLIGWRPFGNQYLDKGRASNFTGLSFLQLAN